MAVNGVPTRPVGTPDITGWGPSTGLLTEITETVPDLTWPQSVSTFSRMRRDPSLAAVLRACFLPIIRATWAVDPDGVDRAEAVDLVASDLGLPILGEKNRKVADSPIRGFRWADHVRLALLNLVFGHYPTEKWFEVRDGRTHLAGWQERPPHTIAFIDVGDDGQVKSVEQNTQTTPIPAKNLVWYANEREGAQWAGVSMLRPCYSAWVLKSETLRVHATSIRRWGVGYPVVKAPPGATPAQLTEAQRLAAGIRGGDQAGAGLPDGFSLDVAGISGSVPDAVAFLRYLDEAMSKSALAGYLELGQTAYGSRALGDTMFDAYLLSLQAAADAVGDTATYGDPAMPGISRMLTDVNWGPDEPCPRIVCTDVGDRHEITAAAIQQLVACGALQADDELEAFIREAWALPARKTPRTPPPAPPQGRPPGSPQPPGGGGAAPAEPSPGRQPPAESGNMPAPAAAWSQDQPRDWHGRWAHTGSRETAQAQDYIAKMTGKLRPRELDQYNVLHYKQDTLDPAFTYSPAQAKAINFYAEHSFEVNSAARGLPPERNVYSPEQVKEITAGLDSAFQPLPGDLILLREVKGLHALEDLQPGDVIADQAFSSTTLAAGGRYASGRDDTTVMHIMTPAGTPVIWANPAAEYPEDEIIFGRDQPLVFMKSQMRPGRTTVRDVYLLALPKDVAA